MDKPLINDYRRIRLEEVVSRDYIPFLGGRPKREDLINKSDILNLKIAFETAKTFEEFLEAV